jgi:hypothetical protein
LPGTIWQLDRRRRGSGLAHFEQLLAQLLELWMLGVQPAQIRVGLVRRRDLLHHVFGLEELRFAVEIRGELRRRIHDAAAAGIARVLQRRYR